MIGFAVSLVPWYYYSGISCVVPFAIESIFSNAGLDSYVRDLVNSIVYDNKILYLVIKNVLDTVMMSQASIQ